MLGDILVNLREEANITQDVLAKAVGISRTMIVKYENNSSEPPLNTLIALANYYNVTIDYLLGRTSIRHGWRDLEVTFKPFLDKFALGQLIDGIGNLTKVHRVTLYNVYLALIKQEQFEKLVRKLQKQKAKKKNTEPKD